MDRKEADVIFNEASRLFEEGRYTDALQRLVMLDRAFPDKFNIQFPLLRCRENLGQRSEARELCSRMARQFPDARHQRRLEDTWKRLSPPRGETSGHNRGDAADDAQGPGIKDNEYAPMMTNALNRVENVTDKDPIGVRSTYLEPGEIVAYTLSVLAVALLGADQFFLYAVFCFDICVYLISRPVKLFHYRHSDGVKWVTICIVILAPAISAAGCAALFFGVTSLADQSPGEIIVGGLILMAAAIGIVQEHISTFRKHTLKLVTFFVHIREKHAINNAFLSGSSTCLGCIVEGYGMLALYALIALVALSVAHLFPVGDMVGHRGDVVAASVLAVVKLGASALCSAAVFAYYGQSTPEEQKRRLLKGIGVNPAIVRRTTDAQPAKDQQPSE